MELEPEMFRRLFEANPRPMFVADRDTQRILIVNARACELYGWTRDELVTMTLRDIRPPQELAAFEASYAVVKDASATYARAARHWTKDGRIIDVTLELAPLMWGDRAVTIAIVTDITGIAHAERRFRLLVEHSADGISLTNEQNIVEYTSPGGKRILGYTPEEVIGRNAGTITHPDDVPQWTAPAPGDTKVHVARIRHRDGSWRWIESSTTNLTHDPAVRAYVSNFRDITERMAAERALVESQQRLEYLLSATSAITYSARASGDFGVTFMSANVEQVLGYPASAFGDDPEFWRSHIHPEDLVMVDAELARLASTESISWQYRFRHRDGTYRWMRDVARVLHDGAGAPSEVIGYWIDVTDQVRAEASLRRSEASFRALIEGAPAATFVHRDDRYVYVNPAAVAMLGLGSADEIIGRSVLDFVHPQDRELVRARIEIFEHAASAPSNGIARMVRADGSVFVIDAAGIRVDFDGEPSTVVIGHDVTERHEMFARMALADRMLSVGTLAAGVAHEINNPLAYVATNLELLAAELPNLRPSEHSKLTEQALHGLVNDARDGVARVSAIVRDLRALSRPEDETRGPVDVVAVLATSIKMAHNEIRHRARIVQSYGADLPFVEGDGSKLGQVFLNLLLNAAQAISDGHADQHEIGIRASATAERTRVRVDITDTGVGIAPAIIQRIFDPFFTTKQPGVGTGLGLSISHQIVRAMNGEITVESEPGKGSTFTVTLPVACAPHVTEPVDVQVGQKARSRILLIDDEAAVGRALGLLLAPETEVVAVVRASDALDRIARGERFDGIVCDLMMPEISGIELYDRIVQLAPECASRIIFMTGGAFTPQAREFLAKLDHPHLEKPFSEAQLRRALERVARG